MASLNDLEYLLKNCPLHVKGKIENELSSAQHMILDELIQELHASTITGKINSILAKDTSTRRQQNIFIESAIQQLAEEIDAIKASPVNLLSEE